MRNSSKASGKPGGTSPPEKGSRFGKSRSGSSSSEPYELILEPQAERDLEKLARADRQAAVRISRKLLSIEAHPHPLELAVPLRNVTIGTHRFRVGRYRAVFEIRDGAIYVTRIGHRRDVYR